MLVRERLFALPLAVRALRRRRALTHAARVEPDQVELLSQFTVREARDPEREQQTRRAGPARVDRKGAEALRTRGLEPGDGDAHQLAVWLGIVQRSVHEAALAARQLLLHRLQPGLAGEPFDDLVAVGLAFLPLDCGRRSHRGFDRGRLAYRDRGQGGGPGRDRGDQCANAPHPTLLRLEEAESIRPHEEYGHFAGKRSARQGEYRR